MRKSILLTAVVFACLIWVLGLGSSQTGASEPNANTITTINPKFMVTPDEALTWHEYKDKSGSTFSGSPSWKRYLTFLEEKLKQCGHHQKYLVL